MSKIHELYGIKAEEVENLKIEYEKLLGLLTRIKNGDVNIEHVEIAQNSWSIKQSGENEK